MRRFARYSLGGLIHHVLDRAAAAGKGLQQNNAATAFQDNGM